MKNPDHYTPKIPIPGQAQVVEIEPTNRRNEVIEKMKKLNQDSDELHEIVAEFVDPFYVNAEKDETGRAEILADLERAKLYHDAGFIKKAIGMIGEHDGAVYESAQMLGFSDLEKIAQELMTEWKKELVG